MPLKFPDVELESKPCPLGCSAGDDFIVAGHDRINGLAGEYQVVKCHACGLMRTDPRPTADSMGYYYPEDYPPYLATRVSAVIARSGVKQWIRAVLDTKAQAIPALKPGRMLEIGCASGSYLHKMASQGWQVTGIEFSPQAAEMARQSGCTVYTGSLESVTMESADLDLVVGWMVLEHLHDPVTSLQKLYDWARPGAYLVLSVPNANSLEFRLFKDRWHALQLPNHLYHYTPETIGKVLSNSGWMVEKIHHQRVVTSLFTSLGYLLEEKGFPRLSRWVTGRPGDRIRLDQLFFPVAWLVAMFGQAGRMTVWARKQ